MISIAMATYNGAQFLREQIDSILNQSIQDFELVACDDCSSDGTFQIMEEYARKDSRLRIFKNEKNLGFKKNFEKVVSLCNGEYVALSDQDDIWLPNHLEILANALGEHDQMSCGKPISVDEHNRELPKQYDCFKMNFIPTSNEDMARHIFLCRSTFQGASMLLRRSFIAFALPIPEGADFHDSWFAALACFAGGLAYIDQPTMRYRRLSDAVTSDSRYSCPARIFIGSVLVNHSVKDRLVFVENIRKRCDFLSHDQENLLNTFERLLKRRKSLLGRIANIPYIFKHFKAVYATDLKHLFL